MSMKMHRSDRWTWHPDREGSAAVASQKKCAKCQEAIVGEKEALLCRGCEYIVHAPCHQGAKLCPKCSKPLVTPAQVADFADARAQAKRKLEYRIAALMTGGAVAAVAVAVGFQAAFSAWPEGWLGMSGGLWLYAGVAMLVILAAAAFVRVRRAAIAVTGLLLAIGLSLGFLPNTLACINAVPGILRKVFMSFSGIPIFIAVAGWWEFGRWKRIPGDSGGVKLRRDESLLAPVMEALSEWLGPLAFWK